MTFLDSHWPLAFGLLAIAAFGSWVFIHSDRSYLLRWAMIPLSLLVAVASAAVYDAGLGYAVAAKLPPRFVYLGHQVVVEQQHKAGIEVWAQAARTRLYRIPYSKPMEEALNRAHEQAKSGLPVVMQRRSAAGAGAQRPPGFGPREMVYESNVLLPSQLNPKESQAGPA
ncbi:MAG TPA: hypothetical protein VN782_16675 [Usitatibacter sp.]|nr:hypothetical protein [Usitatibacter sp.]